MATKIEIRPLQNLLTQVAAVRGEALETMLKQWAVRYRAFTQARFDRFSKGGGNWPALKRSTLLAKARRTMARAREQNRVASGSETDSQREKRLKRAGATYRREKKRIDAGTAKATILRDTGILFAALQPVFVNAPGQLQERIDHGIRVGFGGPGRHPEGGPTIADIAAFHDAGGGNLPQREIIVDPDQATIDGMRSDAERALAKLARDTKN